MSSPLMEHKHNYGSNDHSYQAGYCMVFEATTKYYRFIPNGHEVIITPNTDDGITADEFKNGNHNVMFYDRAEEKYGPHGMNNLFQQFKDNHIDYKIDWSQDHKLVYIVISCKLQYAAEWAAKHEIDVKIHPKSAVEYGQELAQRGVHFPLAAHTDLIYKDPKKIKEMQSINIEEQKKDPFEPEKLTLDHWENIHIAYQTKEFFGDCDHAIYDKLDDEHIIHHSLYLRILYEILTDDTGSNYILQKYLNNIDHPLIHFFALHHIKRPKETTEKFLQCHGKSEKMKMVNGIRKYYGENIAFYFAFLCHYTNWLYPMAALGFIWFIVQMIYGAYNDGKNIAVPGSTIIILMAIMWSTIMIENWYRREWKHRFSWGMMRYTETEVPRPSFEGKVVYSLENGEKIETYKNEWAHLWKKVFSLSTMFLCIMIVIGFVIALFLLRGSNRSDQMLSVGIGVANSIQIFIMNKIYTVLAYKLNEWEGHRLQQDYYNNLVVKRIIFIVVNSFNSLFYIAFFDDNPLYDDNEVRLEAVRIQLVTLFLTALIIQNTLEVLFPLVLTPFLKKLCICCKRKEQAMVHSTMALLLGDEAGDHSIQSAKQLEYPMDKENDEYTLKDIEEQIEMDPSPDVLDNTAEIVVLHGYIMLFMVIFPLMPFLAVINNYFEFRIDYYNLTHSQRPIPLSAAGLGVWKTVLSCFNIIAIFSNLALITFRTTLVSDLNIMQSGDLLGNQGKLIVFYFGASLLLLFIIFVIRMTIDDQPKSVKQAVVRQEIIDKMLLVPMPNNK